MLDSSQLKSCTSLVSLFLAFFFFFGVTLKGIVFYIPFLIYQLVQRNWNNFWMLISYPDTSLNSFIKSSSFGVETLSFAIYSIMSSSYSESFSSSLPIWISFIFIFSLRAVTRTSSTVLNKSGESRHTYLVLDISRKAFRFSPLSIIFIGCWFS